MRAGRAGAGSGEPGGALAGQDTTGYVEGTAPPLQPLPLPRCRYPHALIVLPAVLVLEYYLDTLWKGTLLFVACMGILSLNVLKQVRAPGPHPRPAPPGAGPSKPGPGGSDCPRRPQVQKQETWGFPAYGMAVGLWLVVSSLPRRRLVLNHTRGMYHFSIQGRTVCQGPMHLVYLRLALSSDGDAWDGLGCARERDAAGSGEGRTGQTTAPKLEVPPRRPLAESLTPGQPMEGASSSWSFAATSWNR